VTATKIRGRPSLLTPEVADRLAGLLAGGATVPDAAAAVGVSVRTVQRWRARAWSQRERDQPFVALERRVHAARVAAAARAPVPVEDWRAAAQRLEEMYPSRWAPVGSLDDVLGTVTSLDDVLDGG
jgi:hypothetical protein